jgi:subtilisin-like proprotein convertase family protein
MRSFGFGVALLLVAGAASADTFSATLNQPMSETKHAVSLTIRDGVAHYDVQRTFTNNGDRHDEANVGISLPVGAAATGLRIKAGEHWFEGELMRAERAAEMYRELTGFGPHAPKDPALLFWEWASNLRLQVFPVPPKGQGLVGYSLTAPTEYRNGRYFVSYPRITEGDGLSSPELTVLGKTPRVDGLPIAPNLALSLVADVAKPAWFREREPLSSASYVSSIIDVDDGIKVTKATIDVDISHTYRGDLEVELISPDMKWHPLVERGGGQGNDIRQSFQVAFDKADSKGVWRLVVSDHAGLDTGIIQGWSVALTGLEADGSERTISAKAKDTPRFIPDAPNGGDDGHATISVAAPKIHTVATRLGRVPAGKQRAFSRLEVDAAPQLRPLPKQLSVVFVVDASLSLSVASVEQQLDVARAFTTHVPDASFEIVVYRRFAKRVLGRFAAVSDFDALRKAVTAKDAFALDNGSSLDRGLRLAAKSLSKRRGNRTIVLMSDALMKPSWTNRGALDALDAVGVGATTHIVLPTFGSGSARDRRDDQHALAPIAAKGGGVLSHFEGVRGPTKQLDKIALGLVRPVRIDNFAIVGVQFADGRTMQGTLEEGEGIREMQMMAKAPSKIVLTGKIWARPWRHEVKATLPFSKATAAFVFSHDMHHDLTYDEQFRVAMIGGAVSPVTSYLAIEPGVRPSRVGLEGLGLRGFGAGGGGRGEGLGAGGLGLVSKPDLKALMGGDAKVCIDQHKPNAGWSVTLAVHSTFGEVVDVLSTGKTPLARCLREAAWKIRLPSGLPARDRFDVAFP